MSCQVYNLQTHIEYTLRASLVALSIKAPNLSEASSGVDSRGKEGRSEWKVKGIGGVIMTGGWDMRMGIYK